MGTSGDVNSVMMDSWSTCIAVGNDDDDTDDDDGDDDDEDSDDDDEDEDDADGNEDDSDCDSGEAAECKVFAEAVLSLKSCGRLGVDDVVGSRGVGNACSSRDDVISGGLWGAGLRNIV